METGVGSYGLCGVKLVEATLVSRLLLEQPKRLPDLRLFKRSISVVQIEDRRIAHGIKGQCDLWGTWRGGRHVELEAKQKRGRLSPEQETWRDWCLAWGVPWLQLKPIKGETEEQTIDRWIIEIRLTR